MPDPEHEIAQALAATNTIADGVVGYFRKLVAGGVPADVAGEMAKTYHETIMLTIQAGQAAAALGSLKPGVTP